MNNPSQPQGFHVSLQTPAGNLEATVTVPTQVIPISAIVPLLRSFGERAMSLEEEKQALIGEKTSCKKGCAACCRMMIPVSPPEAFSLMESIGRLSKVQQTLIRDRITDIKTKLKKVGLLEHLVQLSDSRQQLSDDDIEPINQAYYAQRLPCPFLVDEVCSIYEDRPAACRELLVTSPSELCSDMAKNPIRALPVHLRMGTILSLLWKEFTNAPARLIPLPLALDWVERHQIENTPSWTGVQLLEKGMNYMWEFLRQNTQKTP